MPSKRESEVALVRPSPVFATTHWSVVLAAGQHHSDAAATALEQLCRTYWYPLYAYLRRKGYSQRYYELFRQEIAQTVATSAEVEEELRHLCDVMSN